MASWMIHLRVAQQLYQKLGIKQKEEFVLGNIAPDSGVPSEDGTGYVPDATISHFRTIDENGIKNVHEELFIERYFTDSLRLHYSKEEYAFFFGYLTHLITDKIWAREIVYGAKEKKKNLFIANREEFWKTIKKDWYDLDFMYLKENPSFEAFKIYQNNKKMKNVYLDFFSENAFLERKSFIIDFYTEGVKNIVEHETYLQKEELNHFVDLCVDEIINQCHKYKKELEKR